jgi:hypothetical protein
VPEEHRDIANDSKPGLGLTAARGVNERARAKAIVSSFQGEGLSPAEVFDAFWELDALPADDVRDALASLLGPLPDPDRLDKATRLAHGLPLPPLRLRVLSVARDADILDLGHVAEEQLRVAGKSWDGVDLAPEDRLDGELEGSFAGTLERRVLAEAPGETPLFDVLLFGEDAGVVFAAGTANVIAWIAYRKVETRDRRLRSAIEEALAAPVPAAAEVVAAAQAPNEAEAVPAIVRSGPVESAPVEAEAAAHEAASADEALVEAQVGEAPVAAKKNAKTGAAKRGVAKKAAATKVAAKKPAAKKAVAKKPAAKKPAVKKAAPKKPAAKSAPGKAVVAKKAVAKKAVAKKTAVAKKAAAKKPVVKKPVAKKPVASKKTARRS